MSRLSRSSTTSTERSLDSNSLTEIREQINLVTFNINQQEIQIYENETRFLRLIQDIDYKSFGMSLSPYFLVPRLPPTEYNAKWMETNNPIDQQDIHVRMKFLNKERFFSNTSYENFNNILGDTLDISYDRSLMNKETFKQLKRQ